MGHQVLRAIHHVEMGAHDFADALTWFGHEFSGICICFGLLAVHAGWSVARAIREQV
jgi:hypothetical protein